MVRAWKRPAGEFAASHEHAPIERAELSLSRDPPCLFSCTNAKP
jgi:hypothetical protein